MPKRLVIVGAGISGLAAAHAALRSAGSIPGGLEVSVLEREPRVGGKALTLRDGPWTIEAGPTGYLSGERALDDLVRESGLTPLAADPAAARRFVAPQGKPVEIKLSPLALASPKLLGPLGLLRAGAEAFVPKRSADGEESVWAFARRRLGPRFADRLIAPMMLGIFAGDAKRLSLEAAFPRLAEIEREHGSLIRGMIRIKRARRAGAKRRAAGGGPSTDGSSAKSGGAASSDRGGSPAGPAGTLTSFADGLAALPRALASRAGLSVRTAAVVERIAPREGGGFTVHVAGDGEPLPADALVLAIEPWAAAALLAPLAPSSASLLASILCPAVTVVALGFGEATLRIVPHGFGVLVPRGQDLRILGCLWDSHLFSGRAPGGHLLLRAMLGGSVDPAAAALDDAATLELVRDDLRRLLGIEEAPLRADIVRWPRAIPQYETGHVARVAAIEKGLAALPGLFLAGNGLHGIAFGKAAALGVRRGEEAAAYLATR